MEEQGIEDARNAFLEQASALHKAGVDLFIIETMTDLYEIVEAIKAVKSVAPDLPLIASMTFTRDDRTLLGDPPEKVAIKIKEGRGRYYWRKLLRRAPTNSCVY